MKFELRKVGLDDLDDLRRIGIASYLPHYTHLWKPGGVEWYLDRCFAPGTLRRELKDPDIEYYIAADRGEQIGMMKLVRHKPVPEATSENALYLEKIYFVKKWTGKGAGQSLIEFAVNRAADLGCRYVWLMAMDTAAKPIEAYRRAGFEIDSFTRLNDEFALMKEEFRGMAVMKHYIKENGN